MTSFGYRLNLRYAIKECLSCEALYTGEFCCSKGNVEDKILVPKLPKNCARCAKCGHPINGPYCQGYTLLREKLEEDLVTYFQDFQNTFESSDNSTNVVNAPREPVVVKQDHGVNPPHIDESWDRVFKIKDALGTKQYKPEDIQELFRQLLNDVQNIHKDLAEYINTPGWNRPAFYDDDDDDDVDYTIAITPILSTEETENSLSMRDEHLDIIPATESDEVIKSSVEDLVPIPSESKGIPDTISSSDDDSLYKENIEYVEASPHDSELVSLKVVEIVIPKVEEIEDDNLRKKLLNVHLLIANIEALKDNPTPSSKLLTKSSSTSPKSFLEETNTFHNSLSKFENFCFDLEEISSGSTTAHSDISLSEYDSFIFDLSNDQCPPFDRSDLIHKDFTDELTHIISPPEYDCFYFRNLPDPGELISILNSRIRENLSSTTRVNLPVKDDHSPLMAYVVWIFLAYLTYLIIPPYLYSFGNEDTIFDPGIIINHVYSFKPGLSHRCGAFKKFNTHQFVSKNSNADDESFSPSPIMEEIDLTFTPDDPMPPSIEDDEDSEGDILFLERLLHDDPIPLSDIPDFSYEVRIFLPFFTYPDLPHHLEYAFHEGDNKLPVIIAKELRSEEKAALIKVLKSTSEPSLGNYLTFRRCMIAIFHDMIEKTMEVFMDDFSVFENSFQRCLSHLEKDVEEV
nr:reverse transcriptase domain-containing protein [Tanacetum cinerariifolium]